MGDEAALSAAYTQIALGAISGFIVGYVIMTGGKCICFALGGGIILLEIAQAHGYVELDWSEVRQRANNIRTLVEQQADKNYVQRFVNVIKENVRISLAVLGGIFIGIGFA